MRVRESLEKKGFGFVSRSGTNQQFPILPDAALDTLEKEFIFQYEAKLSENANAVHLYQLGHARGRRGSADGCDQQPVIPRP